MTDWNAIKAEYISGGISMRKLALKHGVSFYTLRARSDREKWVVSRAEAQQKLVEKTAQITAKTAANNVAIAERIREKLLKKLEKEIDCLPDSIGSQTQRAVIDNEYEGAKWRRIKQIKEDRQEFRLKDLTAAYKDLTQDMELGRNDEQVRIIIDV